MMTMGYNNRPAFENKRTEIKTVFADDGMMSFSAVGEYVSIRYYPAYNSDSFSAGRKYDTNNPVLMMFNADNFGVMMTALLKEAEQVIFDISKGGKLKKPISYTLANSSENAVKFEYKPDENDVPYGFITIIKGIDPETLEPRADSMTKTIKVEKQRFKDSDGNILALDSNFLVILKKFETLGTSMGSIAHSVGYGRAKDQYFAANRQNYNGNNYNNGGGYNNNNNSGYGNNYSSSTTMSREAQSPLTDDDLPF